MTFGFSRDDAGKYLDAYIEAGILEKDPFVTIDREGVGALMQMAIERARETNPEIKIGVCGEHAGDPESIEFLETLDLNYISCSPARIPAARLAIAQMAIAGEHARPSSCANQQTVETSHLVVSHELPAKA
jgi:pyruvate, orthophosphate dikinase